MLNLSLIISSLPLNAQTVQINAAETTTRDLDTLSRGATPKTAFVMPTGSVTIPAGNLSPAIWGKTDGWNVTVSKGRSVSGGNAGIRFSSTSTGFGYDRNGSVTIQSGATVSGNAASGDVYGISAGSNSSIDNFGNISSSGPAGWSTGVSLAGLNTATSVLMNRNGGTISAAGGSSYGVYATTGSSITNEFGASIISNAANSSTGIHTNANVDNITILNNGSITATSNDAAVGIRSYKSTVTNNGTITASGVQHTNIGVQFDQTSSLINSGTITAHSTSASNGSAIGVVIQGNATNKAGGIISATGPSGATGVSAQFAAINNEEGALIEGSWRGIILDNTSTLINHGTVRGSYGALASWNSTIENYGIITGSGGTAISMNGNNNSIIMHDGSTVTGSINGGSGTGNTIEFIGSGSNASNISGTLALVKSSNGTWIISGANTYTGGTSVSAGILQGNAFSLQGNILNNAQVAFDQSSAGTYAGVMSGTGSLVKSGAGTLNLSGANTYSGGTIVNAGILQGDTSSLQGNILNNAQVAFNQSSTGTYAGVMSGTGSLIKNGSGTLTLSGANTYSGDTKINAGVLSITGSIMSPLNIDGAGIIKGTGTIIGNVINAGLAAPGNSIGTLTITGNYTQRAGSIYQVETNADGQSDRIEVSGTAAIEGGSVSVLAQSGNYAKNTKYTILHAGKVEGAFNNATSNLAFLDPSLSYDSSAVYLTLSRNNAGFADSINSQSTIRCLRLRYYE
jgi:autotransporter-associated beta strand protein